MSEIEVTAPAPTPEPTTISAAVDAASRDDFAAFDAAHLSEKRGDTAARVEVKPDAPAPPAEPERTLSKRQEAANDRTRAAVEQATADLRAELDRVKAQLAAPKTTEPAAPPAQKTPEYRRYLAMPEAPKLADFESVEEHAAAMSFFVAKTMRAEELADAQHRDTDAQRAKFLDDSGQQYADRLIKAKEADPDIVSKIDPQILHALPVSALPDGAPRKVSNLIAETGLFSEDPAGFYAYLSANPDELRRIAAMPSEAHAQRALAQLDGRLSAGRASAAPAAVSSTAATAARPSTITAAPPPVQSPAKTGVTSDPKASALARDDFAAFDRIDQAERASRRGHA